MAKRFKLRICRVITTTLQSCRSKDPSVLPHDPVPSFSSTGQLNHRSSVKHHLSSAEQFHWKKEDKWHVVAKLYQPSSSSSGDDDHFTFAPPAPPPSASEKKKRRPKKKTNRLRIRTSSADSGWFSSDGAGDERNEEETETLISSFISFSTDYSSSEVNPNNSQLQPIQENTQLFTTRRTTNKKRVSKRNKRGGGVKPPLSTAEVDVPARLSMFKKLITCTVDGKVKESFAIVKRSENPYEDFKNSMMDMIVEKQMFDPRDLEQLLECFLSLNSRNYHGIIVQVFSEIWEAIFSQAGSNSKPPPHVQYRPRVSRRASF